MSIGACGSACGWCGRCSRGPGRRLPRHRSCSRCGGDVHYPIEGIRGSYCSHVCRSIDEDVRAAANQAQFFERR